MISRKDFSGVSMFFSVAILAFFLFSALFYSDGWLWLDFWWWMAANNLLLVGGGLAIDQGFRKRVWDTLSSLRLRDLVLGMISALALYFVFFVGNIFSRSIFPFASNQIQSVYALKDGFSTLRIFLLISLVIGPGEELFWRGFLQDRLMSLSFCKDKLSSAWVGMFLATLMYMAVHIASGNLMLILAALVCGIFWGVLYLYFRSLLLNIISHTVWDLLVFLFFPFR